MYGHHDSGALCHTRTVEITDAYAHCGLRKYKPVEALRAIIKENGVSRTVLVAHRGEYDHSYPVMREDSVYREEIGLARTGKLGIPLEAASAAMNDNAVRLWFGPRG
jgi:hypothetical protein